VFHETEDRALALMGVPESTTEAPLHVSVNAYTMYTAHVYFSFRSRFMVFNATFNNISFISWRSVLLAEKTGVLEENHRPVV
jgi:hypothetical protein